MADESSMADENAAAGVSPDVPSCNRPNCDCGDARARASAAHTVSAGRPANGALNSRPPRTYVEWTVRGVDGSSVCFVTFSETDARRHHANWLDHGEPVELVRREVTTWTETRHGPYEQVGTDD